MKKYLKWGVALLIANMTLVSCEDNNDTLEDTRLEKPVLTIDNVTGSGAEGDVVEFTLTTNRPISVPIEFKLDIVDDESVASFRDFIASGDETSLPGGDGKLGYNMTFPAYATSHTFQITLTRDLVIEGNETLELLLTQNGVGTGVIAEDSKRISIVVSDFVSNDISIQLDWSTDSFDQYGSYVEGDFHDYDFDIYVFDNAFNEVSAYQGATGALPENVELLNADLTDGEYIIIVDLYSKPASVPAIPVDLPVRLTVSKNGVWSETIDVPYTSASPVSGPAGLGDGLTVAATLVKTGTTYTLLAGDGSSNTVLASGRMSDLSNLIGKGRNR